MTAAQKHSRVEGFKHCTHTLGHSSYCFKEVKCGTGTKGQKNQSHIWTSQVNCSSQKPQVLPK